MSRTDELQSTRMESADEILKALAGTSAKPPATKGAVATAEPVFPVQVERPTNRPPVALLCILDDVRSGDGKPQGETIRLRGDRTVLARLEGDVTIPHDGWISRKEHAAIVRQKTDKGYRWQLLDLGSTFGTFVRVGDTILRPGDELLLGAGRFRFEAPGEAEAQAAPVPGQGATLLPRAGAGAARSQAPVLVEISHAGDVLQRFPLTRDEIWFGRDPRTCLISRPDDNLVNGKHACLTREAGRWKIRNNGSVNGVWFRATEITLGSTCFFRLGEQQFMFRRMK